MTKLSSVKLGAFLISPITVFGALVSIGTFVLSIWSKKVLNWEDYLNATLLSVQPLIISLLLHSINELLKAKSELIASFSLLQKMHDSQIISPYVERLLTNVSDAGFGKIPSQFIRDRLLTICDRFCLEIEHGARGQIRFANSEWFSIDKELLCGAHCEILATSHADVNEVWDTTVGRIYWEENKRKVAGNVKCCRIFILSRAEIRDNELLLKLYSIMEEQSDAGIDVRAVEEDRLEPELRKDMAIFDQAIYSLTILSRSGGTVGTEVYWDGTIVRKALAAFALTREKAEHFRSFVARNPLR